uniref:DUF6783 domain-containing protein n=1 Tax=Anaerobutyricum hallii TaxID=39488 RepID=UPI004028AFF9
MFCLHSVAVARYAALIQAKSPANCDAHLAESIFQTTLYGNKGRELFLVYMQINLFEE